VATIPINLEFNAWFAVINPNSTSENALISLHDHLLCQPWSLCIKMAVCNKCLIVTTKSNLHEVHVWIDANLEPMVRKSIPPGIDPPASILPWQLNKPVFTATSQTYVDILKKQFSLAPNPTMMETDNPQPPCKRQASIINYDLDQSTEYPPLPNKTTPTSNSSNSQPQSAMLPTAMPPPMPWNWHHSRTKLTSSKQL